MRGWLGTLTLIAALPVALLGVILDANEYKAQGFDGVDCDGPGLVLVVAGLALVVFAAGTIMNGRHFRRRLRLTIALGSALICVPLVANIKSAMGEMQRNTVEETCR